MLRKTCIKCMEWITSKSTRVDEETITSSVQETLDNAIVRLESLKLKHKGEDVDEH